MVSQELAELQQANARFLGFIVLAATGFIGEVQLSIAAHVSGDAFGRIVLGASALCAAFIGGWGGFAAAEAFTDGAFAKRAIIASRMHDVPSAVLAVPRYSWAARTGGRLRRFIEAGVISGGNARNRGIDVLVLAYVSLLALIMIWAIS